MERDRMGESDRRTVGRGPKLERFEDLLVWQKAHELTIAVYRMTSRFPAEERFGFVS